MESNKMEGEVAAEVAAEEVEALSSCAFNAATVHAVGVWNASSGAGMCAPRCDPCECFRRCSDGSQRPC